VCVCFYTMWVKRSGDTGTIKNLLVKIINYYKDGELFSGQ